MFSAYVCISKSTDDIVCTSGPSLIAFIKDNQQGEQKFCTFIKGLPQVFDSIYHLFTRQRCVSFPFDIELLTRNRKTHFDYLKEVTE